MHVIFFVLLLLLSYIQLECDQNTSAKWQIDIKKRASNVNVKQFEVINFYGFYYCDAKIILNKVQHFKLTHCFIALKLRVVCVCVCDIEFSVFFKLFFRTLLKFRRKEKMQCNGHIKMWMPSTSTFIFFFFSFCFSFVHARLKYFLAEC